MKEVDTCISKLTKESDLMSCSVNNRQYCTLITVALINLLLGD